MRNNCCKHTVLLLACWVGFFTVAVGQKADSAAGVLDTVVAQMAPPDSATAGSNDSDTVKTTLSKFNLKQATPVVAERRIPQADTQKLANDKDFWYANKPMPGEEPVVDRPWLANLFRVIFWVLVGAIAVGIVVVCLRMFGFKGRVRYVPAMPLEEAADNIFDMDFDSRLANALAGQDYRLATRLLFLRLLRTMADRNIIGYSIEKTNFDYLFELGGSPYFNNFSAVAKGYEYVWYGNFNIQQSQFMLLRQRLDELTSQINN
jgi:hypothetical protein